MYFAFAGESIAVVQTMEKLADRGNHAADSQVSPWREVRSSSLVEGMR